MKIQLAIALALLTIISSQAETNHETVKVADGSVVQCKNKYDIQNRRNRLGAYRAKAISAEIEGDTIKMQIALRFLKCQQMRGQVGFMTKSPYERTVYSNPVAGDLEHQAEVIVNEVRLKGFKQGVYDLIVNQRLKNQGLQVVSIEVPIEKVIANGNAYQNFNANLDLFISKQITFQDLGDTSKSFDDITNFGAFRVHLKVVTNEGVQKVILL